MTTTLEAQTGFQNWQQDTINTIAASAGVIQRIADQANEHLPQYAGHWDGWRLHMITRSVRTKMGEAFQLGDLVIGHDDDGMFIAYSVRNRIDTAVPYGDVVAVESNGRSVTPMWEEK